MSEKMDSVEIVQLDPVDAYGVDRAAIDVQVSTARKFPRSTRKCIEEAVNIATISPEVAKSCGYALPRAGKTITGPSIHLAKIIIQSWGNIRAGARIVNIDADSVTSEAVCWDMEKNVAISVTSRKRIVDKEGKRYSDDMVNVTASACSSIALRNAVFTVIPKSVVEHVYSESQKVITGDLSDETKFINERNNIVKRMSDSLGVSENEILSQIGRPSVQMITREDIAILIGLGQAIKDGEWTVDELFRTAEKKGLRPRAEQIARKKQAERLRKSLRLMNEEQLNAELDRYTSGIRTGEEFAHLMDEVMAEINEREPKEDEQDG